MLTAMFTGHEVPDFDEALIRQLGGSQLVQNGPAHRFGFLSDAGEVYRIVLCHDDDECRRVRTIALDLELQEVEASSGYVKLFGRVS